MTKLFALALLLAGAPKPTPVEVQITKADTAVRSAKYIEALAAARKAIALDAQNFKGHYYEAYALYKTDALDDAAKSAAMSLELAPEAEKPNVQKLVDAIPKRRAFLAAEAEGERALAEGLVAKGAAALTRAYEESPSNEQTGLKAAKLWAEKLGEPARAAGVLNSLVQTAKDEGIRTQASQLLQQLGPELQRAYQQNLQRGEALLNEGKLDEAAAALQQAAAAGSNQAWPVVHLARIAARQRQLAAFRDALKQVAARSGATIENVMAYEEIWPLFGDATLFDLVSDAFGPSAADRARSEYRRRLDERNAREATRLAQLKAQQDEENAKRKIATDLTGTWRIDSNESDIPRTTDSHGGKQITITQNGDQILVRRWGFTLSGEYVEMNDVKFTGRRQAQKLFGTMNIQPTDCDASREDFQTDGEISADGSRVVMRSRYYVYGTTFIFNCTREQMEGREVWIRQQQ